MNSSPAFTLIELLVVVSVIGILSAATIPVFNSFTQAQRLNQAAKQVKQDLRSAQNRALSSIDGKAWGIYFVPGGNSYTPFSCPPDEAVGPPGFKHQAANSNCVDSSTSISLPSSVTINPISTVQDAAFDAVSGDVYEDGDSLTAGYVWVEFNLSGVTPKRVTIYAGGKIED